MTLREFYIAKTGFSPDSALPYPVATRTFKKGACITRYGEIQDAVYFLNSGVVEMTIKSYMTEKIIDFFFAGHLFTSLTSFLTQQPSDVQMTALTDCEVEMFTWEDLYRAYETSFEANKFGRLMLEQSYLQKARREKDFLSKTAEERYAEMFETHRQYLSQIPVNKIAKYLGIHPESLSRIRRKLNS